MRWLELLCGFRCLAESTCSLLEKPGQACKAMQSEYIYKRKWIDVKARKADGGWRVLDSANTSR